MSDFVSLSCPNCGGKLEIGESIERFACQFCGVEQVVKRGGGIVSLSPVVDELKKVREGTDRTADELAIRRLKEELSALEYKEAAYLGQARSLQPQAKVSSAGGYFAIMVGVFAGMFGLYALGKGETFFGLFFLGVAVFAGCVGGSALSRKFNAEYELGITKPKAEAARKEAEAVRKEIDAKRSDIERLVERTGNSI